MNQSSCLGLKRNFRGFTLLEMAIVLSIIGLIMGAIFKVGPSMQMSSKVRSTMTFINDISDSQRSFKSQYHYLPGDIPTATTRIPAATTNGNGNGIIDAEERMLVGQHMFLAGLIKRNTDSTGTAPFETSFGRAWLISATLARSASSPCTGNISSTTGVPVDNTPPSPYTQNVILLESLPTDAAREIDDKLDDGKHNSGAIRSSGNYSDTTITTCIAISA